MTAHGEQQLRSERDELAEQLRIAQTQRDHWLRETFRLADKDGWFAFGHHANNPEMVGRLEFDGIDEDGLPMWERPIAAPTPAGPAQNDEDAIMIDNQPITGNDLAALAIRLSIAADDAAPAELDPRVTRRIIATAFRELGRANVSLAARVAPERGARSGQLVFPTGEQMAIALDPDLPR